MSLTCFYISCIFSKLKVKSSVLILFWLNTFGQITSLMKLCTLHCVIISTKFQFFPLLVINLTIPLRE